MLSKKQIIGIKSETTQGTPIALTATDYFLASNADINPVVELLPRDYAHMTLGQLASVVGQVYVEIKFSMHVKGSGTAGTPFAPLSAVLQAAGMSETIVAVTSVTYAPLSNTITNFYTLGKSATVEFYRDANATLTGHKWVIAGAVVTALKASSDKAGHLVTLDVTMRGLYSAAIGATGPATVTYSTLLPPIFQNAALAVDGYSGIASKFDIDFGIESTTREDLSSPYGIKGFQVTGRKPKLTIDPEMTLPAAYDWFGKFVAGNQGAFTALLGATAGNKTTITAPKAQYTDVKYGDRSGILTAEVTAQLNENTGDDEFSIAQT